MKLNRKTKIVVGAITLLSAAGAGAAVAASQDSSPSSESKAVIDDAAKQLGIPLHDFFVDSLRNKPLRPFIWFHFVSGADETRMDEALLLARELLDYGSIATGPAEESDVGPGRERYMCINYILQELRRFPGKGWEVIRISLRSPTTTNRRYALMALRWWRSLNATKEVISEVRNALSDPSEQVRKEAGEVLAILEPH